MAEDEGGQPMDVQKILLYEIRELRKEVKGLDGKIVNLRLQFVRIKIMSGFWGACSGLGTAIATLVFNSYRR